MISSAHNHRLVYYYDYSFSIMMPHIISQKEQPALFGAYGSSLRSTGPQIDGIR
jgi:hypothetical protein